MADNETAYSLFNRAYTKLQTFCEEGGTELQTFMHVTQPLLQSPDIALHRKALLLLARVFPEVPQYEMMRIEWDLFAKSVMLDDDEGPDARLIRTVEEMWRIVRELKEVVDAVLAPQDDQSEMGCLTARVTSSAEVGRRDDELVVVVKPDAASADESASTMLDGSNTTLDDPQHIDSKSQQPEPPDAFQSGQPNAPSAARLEIMRIAKEAGYHDEPGKPSAKLKDLFAKSVALGFGGDQPYKNPMLKRAEAPTPSDP